jgi:hypothetical protein
MDFEFLPKEILAEVFHARPGEVEVMILNRLDESEAMENILAEKHKDGLWPMTFVWVIRDGTKFQERALQSSTVALR